ncbi:MAG: hypothetical protein VCC00_11700 [Deltaproteobacteria bacterium]
MKIASGRCTISSRSSAWPASQATDPAISAAEGVERRQFRLGHSHDLARVGIGGNRTRQRLQSSRCGRGDRAEFDLFAIILLDSQGPGQRRYGHVWRPMRCAQQVFVRSCTFWFTIGL